MQHSIPKSVAAIVLLNSCIAAHADTLGQWVRDYQKASTSGTTSHVVDIENDTLLLKRNDGFYSSGLQYTQRYTLRDDTRLGIYGWRLGQQLYTASDIKLAPQFISPSDHPYAGWIFGGVFRHIYHRDGTYNKVGVDIGCLGPCAGGRWTQTNFHRILNQPLPQGWSKQVRNELGAVLYADMAPVKWQPAESLDITPSIKGRFGNIFTDVGGGVLLRAGRLNVFPNQPALYAYMQTDISIVGYNATLQGGYFSKNNPHTVAPRRVVGNAALGVAWQQNAWSAALAVHRRSSEIRGLSNSQGAQNFLQLQFSYTP